MLAVAEVDAMDEATFTATFGGVYEDGPALAAVAWRARPFGSREALMRAFAAAADALDEHAALALLRAHPQLGARTPMGAASTGEQAGAGLDHLDARLQARIADGNRRYLERFGFPFILAVRGLDAPAVAAALDERLGHDAATERAAALAQVQRIARLRLEQLVAP